MSFKNLVLVLIFSLIVSISSVSAFDDFETTVTTNIEDIDNVNLDIRDNNVDDYYPNNLEFNDTKPNTNTTTTTNSTTNLNIVNSLTANNTTASNSTKIYVSVDDVIVASSYYKKYLEDYTNIPSTVTVGGNKLTSYQFIYVLSVAILKINDSKINELIEVLNCNVVNPSFNNFRLDATKAQYLSLVKTVIKNVKNNKKIPGSVTISKKTLDYKSYSYGLAKILLEYNSKKTLPKSHIFSASILAPDTFFTQYYGKDVTFYLTSDRISSSIANDKKMLKKLASTLNKLGYKTKIVGVGPNMHNVAYKYGCKGKKAVLLACFSGVDVGCLEEWTGDAGKWFKRAYKGAHMLAIFYSAPYALSSNLNKKVGQSWDADYGFALSNPANYLSFHGINYIQARSPDTVCNVLTNTFKKSRSKSVIKAKSIKVSWLYSKNLVIKLTNSKGKSLANKNIFVRINGLSKFYKLITNSKGIAKVKFKGSIKVYKVLAYFPGDKSYMPSYVKSKITVTRAKSVLKVPVVKSYTNKTTYLTIYLKNSAGKALSKKKVRVKIKGSKKIYYLVTNSEGVAKLKFSNKPKIYSVIVKYAGNKKYLPSSRSSKVKVYRA